MPRFTVAILSAALIAPLPAKAQEPIGWLELFQPELIMQQLVQAGIMALRSQIDLTYGDMVVDLRQSRLTMTDITLWPFPEWDLDGGCVIGIDRLSLKSSPIDTVDKIRLKIEASGVYADGACLPPEGREPLRMLGQSDIELPHMTFDIEHEVPSAATSISLYTDIQGAFAASLDADFSYFWFDASYDPDEPEPVAFLRSASLTLENHGAWEGAVQQLPPPFTNPEQAGLVLSGMIGQNLGQMNAAAADADAEGDPTALTPAQQALVDSVAAAWPAFLSSPSRLVLETGFDPSEEVFLDLLYYEDEPTQAIEDLRPILALAPASARRALPVDRIRAVLDALNANALNSVPQDEILVIGTALLTGQGAPRDRTTGRRLLAPLAQTGNGEAALAMSDAMEAARPEDAYRYALIAAAEQEVGAAARLDRLEVRLPFGRVLELQSEFTGNTQLPSEALADVGQIRSQAQMRASGSGAIRSYELAALWAILGAAAGDAESADILETLDERARLAGAEAQRAWDEAEGAASALAMRAWLEMDLPTILGGN